MKSNKIPGVVMIGTLSVLLTILISGFYMKGLMFSPNNHAPTFGGDGLTIHYNLQYHASHGEGTRLTSQYHPHDEAIFMTDAQGIIAWALASLRSVIPNIGDYAVGISNVLIYWSNPIAALFLFLCLIKLEVDPKYALLFSILIALLSPQIHRQTCGHYALGHAYLLPMVFYHALHVHFNKWTIIRTILVTFILVILGLNNPYLLAISGAFLLACGGIGLLMGFIKRKTDWRVSLSLLLTVVVALLVTNGILHSLDNIDDRVEVPFGFFDNIASIKGLLFPEHTWISKPISKLVNAVPNSFESRCYIGLVPGLFLLSLPLLFISKGRNIKKTAFSDNQLFIIFMAAIAVLIFSFGHPFSMAKEWSYAHLGKILQFRAPGRFTWVFYFAIGLTTAKVLSVLLTELKINNKKGAAIGLLSIVTIIWGFDVHQFLDWRQEGRIHQNSFSPAQLQPYRNLAKDLDLDTSHYEGIYLLPTEHGWTDKVMHHGSFRSNYEGYRFSIATGLPLINGKLSRMSLGQTLSSMALVSHQTIKKDILNTLPEHKSILLVTSLENELSDGEKILSEAGIEIHRNDKMKLVKLDIGAYRDSLSAIRKSLLSTEIDSLTWVPPIIYDRCEQDSRQAYSGLGSMTIEKGKHVILSLPLSESKGLDTLEMSFWYFADRSRYGGPRWKIQCKSEGKVTFEDNKYALDILDTQSGWLRVNVDIPVPEGSDELSLNSTYQFEHSIDDIMVKQKNQKVKTNFHGEVFYNNYKIEE